MYAILNYNPQLRPYTAELTQRVTHFQAVKAALAPGGSLSQMANGHFYFGIHHHPEGWVYREWAPAAQQLWLTGEFNHWNPTSHPLRRLEGGVWELVLPGRESLWQGCAVKTLVQYQGAVTEHIPLYARYVTQDAENYLWCARVWEPEEPFPWHPFVPKEEPLLIYEAHVGMAQEKAGIGSYRAFADNTLPWIAQGGYNTVELMAIMEHPYYASFGYQVSNFFAPSSRFGTPEELKYLIDRAHQLGLRVLLDLVHSHAVGNQAEGIHKFDGTVWQFFHSGSRGDHPAWGTKLFDYGKHGVLHFLLSNVKYWLTEFHFDGFRFDGVTSMLYRDHGLGAPFDRDERYFGDNVDEDALTYLQLANDLIREAGGGAAHRPGRAGVRCADGHGHSRPVGTSGEGRSGRGLGLGRHLEQLLSPASRGKDHCLCGVPRPVYRRRPGYAVPAGRGADVYGDVQNLSHAGDRPCHRSAQAHAPAHLRRRRRWILEFHGQRVRSSGVGGLSPSGERGLLPVLQAAVEPGAKSGLEISVLGSLRPSHAPLGTPVGLVPAVDA